ncbi:MAG TPA: hypothetical protein DIU37_00590 [Opitutae bacterium]|nr:hypothetical protein [Opitutae bacterium]
MKEQTQANFRAYGEAQKLCAQFWQKPVKVETLLEKASTTIRAQVQPLVLGAIRHKRLIDWVLDELLRRAPKREARSLLIVALGEYLSETPAHAVVDHAVKLAKARLSAAEAHMVNAVLRKGVTLLEGAHNWEDSQQWGVRYSHPDDLVARWLDAFGEASTRALLKWNQLPSPVYINIEQGVDLEPIKGFLESSKWPHFYRLKPGAWPHVQPLLQS